METLIRERLYNQMSLPERPLFNPMGVSEVSFAPLVIDLTRDVCNHSEMIHLNTDDIRKLVSQASAVVCDTEALVTVIRQYTTAPVLSAPFGYCPAKDFDDEKGVRVGLLNHNPDTQMNNEAQRPLLKKLKEEYLIFGAPVDGVEGEIVEDFNEFAARCDILLLPSVRNFINSTTLPLSVMMAGTCVVAHNSRGYYSLNPAPGVIMIDGSVKTPSVWRNAIQSLYAHRQKFEQAKIHNARYARRVSDESCRKIGRLSHILKTQALPVLA